MQEERRNNNTSSKSLVILSHSNITIKEFSMNLLNLSKGIKVFRKKILMFLMKSYFHLPFNNRGPLLIDQRNKSRCQ